MHNTPKKYLTFHSMSGIIVSRGKGKAPSPKGASAGKQNKMEEMTRLELLTVMLSIKALLESGNSDKALELINEVISEAKRKGSDN